MTLSQPGGQRCVQYWAEQGSSSELGRAGQSGGVLPPDTRTTHHYLPGAAHSSVLAGGRLGNIPANGGAQPRYSLLNSLSPVCHLSLSQSVFLSRNTADFNRPRLLSSLTT